MTIHADETRKSRAVGTWSRPSGPWALGCAGVLLLLGGCNLTEHSIPALGGPAALSLSFEMSAAPDILIANGVSTASVQVVARNQNGQPVSGQGIFFELTDEEGRFVTIGRLSLQQAITNGSGIAQVIYTSPPRTDATGNQSVRVGMRPIGTDATGQIFRSVRIELRSAEPRLFPQDPNNAGPTCMFLLEPSTGPYAINQDIFFNTTSFDNPDPNGVPGEIIRYEWSFGDGFGDEKPDVIHRYRFAGAYSVVHVVTDNDGAQDTCGADVVVQ